MNSRIGKRYKSGYFSGVPDEAIFIEAATRNSKGFSTLIKPSTPVQIRQDLGKWKLAVAYAENIDTPNRNPLYDVYKNIMIDLHLSSIIDTRVERVKQSKFVIKNGDKINEEATKLFQKEWFQDFLGLTVKSKFWGYILAELFDFDEKGELKNITEFNKYHVKPEKGIITKEANDDKGWDYLNGNTSLYYLPIGKSADLGYLLKIAPAALAKKFALGIWGEYNEKIGIPFRSVTSPYNDGDRRVQLGVIMENMGSAGWAVLNEGEKVELLQVAAGDPYKCFQELIKVLDSQMSKFVLGQDSTADGASKTGTYGSMEVLQEISEDRHESDLINACNIINNVLFPKLRLLGYKLSDTDVFEWDKSLELGVAEFVDYVEKLSPFYDIDAEEITKKTSIKLTAKKTEAAPGGAVPKK